MLVKSNPILVQQVLCICHFIFSCFKITAKRLFTILFTIHSCKSIFLLQPSHNICTVLEQNIHSSDVFYFQALTLVTRKYNILLLKKFGILNVEVSIIFESKG